MLGYCSVDCINVFSRVYGNDCEVFGKSEREEERERKRESVNTYFRVRDAPKCLPGNVNINVSVGVFHIGSACLNAGHIFRARFVLGHQGIC